MIGGLHCVERADSSASEAQIQSRVHLPHSSAPEELHQARYVLRYKTICIPIQMDRYVSSQEWQILWLLPLRL